MITVRIGGCSCRLEGAGNERDYLLLTCLVTERGLRRLGHATFVIKACQVIASSLQLNIRLWVGSFDDRPMDNQQLFEFYQKHGFEFFDSARPNWLEWRYEP